MFANLIRYAGALSALILGLSAGAMLTEAFILVRYWRGLEAGAFLEWYAANHALLVSFYRPLQIAGAAVALLVCLAPLALRERPSSGAIGAAVLSVAVLALFFIFFRDANAEFMSGTLALDEVAGRLERWERWQWLRTAIGIGAAGFAVYRPRAAIPVA